MLSTQLPLQTPLLAPLTRRIRVLVMLLAPLAAACGGSDGDQAPQPSVCKSQSDCDSTSLCVAGACVRPCIDDAGCSGARNLCDPSLRICVRCVDATQCAAGEFCADGDCAPDVCVAGAQSCDAMARAARVCREDGGGYAETRCQSRQSCRVEAGLSTCADWVCTAGAATCDPTGATLTVCAPDGLDQTTTDCTAGGGRCVEGQCEPVVCEANGYVCQNGESFRCNATGTKLTFDSGCGVSEFCDESTGRCSSDSCQPGARICDGSIATTCLADGSGPAPGGTDCALDQLTCEEGACAAATCVPDQFFCDRASDPTGMYVMHCQASGAMALPELTCNGTEHCDVESAACVANVCYPGSSACDGETLGTCTEDGAGILEPGEDCAAQGLVCSLAGACADQDISRVSGVADRITVDAGYLAANEFFAHSSRTLTAIEQDGAPPDGTTPGTSELTFFVYQADSADDDMSLIFQKTVTADDASEFQRSGEISVPLAKGKYYAMGMRSASPFVFSIGRDALEAPLYLSFAQWVGARSDMDPDALDMTLAGSTPLDTPYVQELTLAPP